MLKNPRYIVGGLQRKKLYNCYILFVKKKDCYILKEIIRLGNNYKSSV